MSNKIATMKVSLSYTDEEGNPATLGPIACACPYQGQIHGALDVPDAEASATVHAVPFGSIGTAATLAIIENKTGQELAVKLNGAATASHHIAAGGVMAFGEAVAPGTTPLTSISLTTTAPQVGAGTIAFHLFGDPV